MNGKIPVRTTTMIRIIATKAILLLLVLFFFIGQAQASYSTSGLIGRWSFDETLIDTSGLSHNGVWVSNNVTVNYTNGRYGSAVGFNGSTYINTTNVTDYDFNLTEPYSFTIWEKMVSINPSSDPVLIGIFDTNANGYTLYLENASGNNNAIFTHYCGNGTSSIVIQYDHKYNHQPITDNKWHLLAITNDGQGNANGIKYYYDGILVTNSAILSNSASGNCKSSSELLIGSIAYNQHVPYNWTGQLDEVQIYNRTLDSLEILNLYNDNSTNDIRELANGKQAWASKYYTTYTPAKVVNGILTDYWLAESSGSNYPQSWGVDLGTQYNVSIIRLMYYNDRAYNLNISTSLDNISYTEQYADTSFWVGVNDNWLQNITILPTVARYVKVWMVNEVYSTKDVAMLEEVQVWGEALDTYPKIISWGNNYTNTNITDIYDITSATFLSFNITTDSGIGTYYWSVNGIPKSNNQSIFNTSLIEINNTISVYFINVNGSSGTKTWQVSVVREEQYVNITQSGSNTILQNKYWKITSNNSRLNITSLKMDTSGTANYKEILYSKAFLELTDGASYTSEQNSVSTIVDNITGATYNTLRFHLTYRTDIWFNFTLFANNSVLYITPQMTKGAYSLATFIFVVPVNLTSSINGGQMKYLNYGDFAGNQRVTEFDYPAQYAIFKESTNNNAWEAYSYNGSMSALYQENKVTYNNFLFEFEWYNDMPYTTMLYDLKFMPMTETQFVDKTTKYINTSNSELNKIFNSLAIGVKERYQTSVSGLHWLPYRDGKNHQGMFPHDVYHLGTAASWTNITTVKDVVSLPFDNLQGGRVWYNGPSGPYTWSELWVGFDYRDDCSGVQNSMELINAYDYVTASNDTVWLNNYWTKLYTAMHYYDAVYNTSYNMLYYSNGQRGWAEQFNLNGFATEINVLYAKALEDYAMMALKKGNSTEYLWAWNRRNLVISSINTYLWNSNTGFYYQQMDANLTYPTNRFYTLGNLQMVNFGYTNDSRKNQIHNYMINSTGVVGQEIIHWGNLSGWIANNDLQFNDSDYPTVKKQTNFFVNALDAPEFLARTNETLFGEFVNSSYMTEDIHGSGETIYNGLAAIEAPTGQWRRGGIISYQANGFGLMVAIEKGVFGIDRQMYGLVIRPEHKISSFYNKNTILRTPYRNTTYNVSMTGNGTLYEYTIDGVPYYADKLPLINENGTKNITVTRVSVQNLSRITLIKLPVQIYVINTTNSSQAYNFSLYIPSGNYNLTFDVPLNFNQNSNISYDGIITTNWTYSNITNTIELNVTGGSIHYIEIVQDLTPSPSITNLTNLTTFNSVNWTWTDPIDVDFDHVQVYFNGIFDSNIYAGTQYFYKSSLQSNTNYTISTRTVDTVDNINQTWVNQTTKTLNSLYPNPITNLQNTTNSTGIRWAWTSG